MYVRTCVCMYACMHACMYVCMYVRMYVCTYVRMYVCMYMLNAHMPEGRTLCDATTEEVGPREFHAVMRRQLKKYMQRQMAHASALALQDGRFQLDLFPNSHSPSLLYVRHGLLLGGLCHAATTQKSTWSVRWLMHLPSYCMYLIPRPRQLFCDYHLRSQAVVH